jgi:hypothetical protein
MQILYLLKYFILIQLFIGVKWILKNERVLFVQFCAYINTALVGIMNDVSHFQVNANLNKHEPLYQV